MWDACHTFSERTQLQSVGRLYCHLQQASCTFLYIFFRDFSLFKAVTFHARVQAATGDVGKQVQGQVGPSGADRQDEDQEKLKTRKLLGRES